MFAAIGGRRIILQGSHKSSKFRSDFAATKQTSQFIYIGGEYVFANIRSQVVMAEKLRRSREDIGSRND